MNPLVAAAVWAGAGAAGAALLPAIRLRRLAVLVPVAGLVAVLAVLVLPGTTSPAAPQVGPLRLDRSGQGLLMASAISMTLVLLLAPTVQGRELVTVGLVGAGAVIAVSATDPVVWALGLLGATVALALRWVAVNPSRATMAAGRVAIAGAAALLAAAPFIPVTVTPNGPRPVLVAALLACGLAALLGVFPVGGWALGGLTTLRSVDTACWAVLLAPAALLTALRSESALPPVAAGTMGGILLTLGLLSALWNGVQSTRAAPGRRYGRVLLADLSLAAASLGSGHPALALSGGLFLVLTHLVLAPLLLQQDSGTSRQRRLAWLLLSGVPPAPSFWGRFLLLQAIGQVSPAVLALTAVVMGSLFVASAHGAWGGALERVALTSRPATLVTQLTAWLVLGGGVALGLVSQTGVRFVFGGV